MELTASTHISEHISMQSRHYFSLQHIQSAALFTKQCYQIEKSYDGTLTDELIAKHRSYVIGSIFAAVSFLEATINELFADTVDHPNSELASPLDSATKQLMADMWKHDIPIAVRQKVELLTYFEVLSTDRSRLQRTAIKLLITKSQRSFR
jgi:hypothetical protein